MFNRSAFVPTVRFVQGMRVWSIWQNGCPKEYQSVLSKYIIIIFPGGRDVVYKSEVTSGF